MTKEKTLAGLLGLSLWTLSGASMAQDLDLIEDLFRTEIDVAATGQSFGWEVDIDGDWAAISAPFVNGQDGAVYLFRFQETPVPAWQYIKQLDLPPEPSNLIRFGVSLSISGDWIAVTADFRGVHLYGRNVGGSDNWGYSSSIFEEDTASRRERDNSLFVDLQDTTLVVGAGETDYVGVAGGSATGSVLVYDRDQGGPNSWGLVQTIDTPMADFLDLAKFGKRVAIDGDVMVVGSEGFPASGFSGAGRAWVFERDSGIWTLAQTLNTSDPDSNTFFGADVDVSGNTVVVGGRRAAGDLTPLVSNDGSAYVFSRDQDGPGAWGRVVELTPSTPSFINEFGRSLDVEDGLLWVGAEDGAYLFSRAAGTWKEVDKNPAPVFTPPSNTLDFGWSAALGLRKGGVQVLGLIGDQVAENSDDTRVGAAFFYFYDDGLFSDSFEN